VRDNEVELGALEAIILKKAGSRPEPNSPSATPPGTMDAPPLRRLDHHEPIRGTLLDLGIGSIATGSVGPAQSLVGIF
jgi:hypothetical protein